MQRVSTILREHSIVLPPDLALLFKALITLEGFGRQFDPEMVDAFLAVMTDDLFEMDHQAVGLTSRHAMRGRALRGVRPTMRTAGAYR